jgi:hypothetical protein
MLSLIGYVSIPKWQKKLSHLRNSTIVGSEIVDSVGILLLNIGGMKRQWRLMKNFVQMH